MGTETFIPWDLFRFSQMLSTKLHPSIIDTNIPNPQSDKALDRISVVKSMKFYGL